MQAEINHSSARDRAEARPVPWRRRLLLLVLAVAQLLAACSLGLIPAGTPSQPAPPQSLITADPNATATPTPFRPVLPSSTPASSPSPTVSLTPTETPLPPWHGWAAPQYASPTEIPTPMPLVQFNSGVFTVIVMGADTHRGSAFRTDVMMIVVLDPRAGTATTISIPRDLYVYIPGSRMNRINTAYPGGGYNLMAATLRYNLGIWVQHYALINFQGFKDAVDTIGGVEVEVTRSFVDKCPGLQIEGPGTYAMDGRQALCYVRARKASSDFDRNRRQQEMVLALFDRIISLDGLNKASELHGQLKSMVTTDIGLGDVLSLLPLAARLAADPSRIRQYRITSTMAPGWRTPTGAAVRLPQYNLIWEMLATAFNQ